MYKMKQFFYQRWGDKDAGYIKPWWLGLMWRDPIRFEHVVCMMPFNLFARLVRALWIWMIHPLKGLDPIFGEVKYFEDLFQKEMYRRIQAEDSYNELLEKFDATVRALVNKQLQSAISQLRKDKK